MSNNVAGHLKTYGYYLWTPFKSLYTWLRLSMACCVSLTNWKRDKILKSKYFHLLPCNCHPLTRGCPTTVFPAQSHPHLWLNTASVYSAWFDLEWLNWMRCQVAVAVFLRCQGSFKAPFNCHSGYLSRRCLVRFSLFYIWSRYPLMLWYAIDNLGNSRSLMFNLN